MSIQVSNICKSFGQYPVLNNVNLEVKTGELIALLGPSGSGKTTLLRIIAGLDQADSGNVMIEGEEASKLNIKERNVGFVFQHYALFKHMSVFENVAFGLKVRPKSVRPSERDIRDRVMRLLELVHLDQFHNRYPAQLSGGQRQRVALARALAVEPKLLLLDEPFGALDAKVRKELRRWLRRLHDDIHITSIFVTHDQEEAMEVSDRVVVMNAGTIEQVGSPEDVYHRPISGFVYDFLGNYNEFAGWRDEKGVIHLAEDDLWEAPPASAVQPAARRSHFNWLNRYPEVSGLVKRVLPGMPLPSPQMQTATQPAALSPRQRMRARLAERGVPVRVFARPHEMFVTRTPEEGHEYIPVRVIHINPAGSLAKLEMQRKNGVILQAEVPKTIIDALHIRKGDELLVRPKNVRVFE